MWDFRCPQLVGWAGPLLPEQPNCQGNQTAPTWMRLIELYEGKDVFSFTSLESHKDEFVGWQLICRF